MSDQKQNCLSFGQKRQIICLLDEGVSHFVDRLDTFCTYFTVGQKQEVGSIFDFLKQFYDLEIINLHRRKHKFMNFDEKIFTSYAETLSIPGNT